MEVLVTLAEECLPREFKYLASIYGNKPFIVKTSKSHLYQHLYICDYSYMPRYWFKEVVVKKLSYEEML
jgi:hypothetical protein